MESKRILFERNTIIFAILVYICFVLAFLFWQNKLCIFENGDIGLRIEFQEEVKQGILGKSLEEKINWLERKAEECSIIASKDGITLAKSYDPVSYLEREYREELENYQYIRDYHDYIQGVLTMNGKNSPTSRSDW